MGGIILSKNNSKLEFIVDESDNKRVVYDFKDNSFTSYTGRNIKLSTVKSLFSKFGHRLDESKSNPIYIKLFKMMEGKWGCPIYNLGTKLDRLSEYKYTEKYLSQGYNVNDFISDSKDKLLSKVNKLVKKVYKENNIDISTLRYFKDTDDKYGIFLQEILNRYDSEFMNRFLNSYQVEYLVNNLRELFTHYRYNPKSLANYLCDINDFEALYIHDGLRYLFDYITMNKQMGVNKPEKYPRHLHTTHDIVVRNFNAFKIEYPDALFENIRRTDYEYIGKKYSIIYPKCYREIQKEGAVLNHCVASYVEKVMNGKTHIVFLRETEKPDESLVTVEIRNEAIVQYRGSYNRNITLDELDFLNIYAKIKKLRLD